MWVDKSQADICALGSKVSAEGERKMRDAEVSRVPMLPRVIAMDALWGSVR
jgi:hypothetical protein